jgi:hypothetical protein
VEKLDNNLWILGLGVLGGLIIAKEQHETWKRIQFKALFHEKRKIIQGLDDIEEGLQDHNKAWLIERGAHLIEHTIGRHHMHHGHHTIHQSLVTHPGHHLIHPHQHPGDHQRIPLKMHPAFDSTHNRLIHT